MPSAAPDLYEGDVTITITNGGAQLTNTQLTDSLPVPLLLVTDGFGNPDGASITCTGGTISAVDTGGFKTGFTLSGATVPASDPSTNAFGTCTVTAKVKLDPTYQSDPGNSNNNIDPHDGTITNTVEKESFTNTEGLTPPEDASDTVRIHPARGISF